MNYLIEVKKITKKINGKVILKDISFNVKKGTITVLLGPNGSGKTTTLKILSNLIKYDEGELKYHNDIRTNHKDIMIIFDEPILYEELTGIEHIEFISQLYNIKLDKNYINDYLKLFELEESIYKTIGTYSLGMKKKLQLLCTIINKPKVLLMDEYISGLDPSSLYNIKKILRKYVNDGNSVLLSTHMLDVAEKFCDRVILINNGQVLNNGESDIFDIKSKYDSLEDYYMKTIK